MCSETQEVISYPRFYEVIEKLTSAPSLMFVHNRTGVWCIEMYLRVAEPDTLVVATFYRAKNAALDNMDLFGYCAISAKEAVYRARLP